MLRWQMCKGKTAFLLTLHTSVDLVAEHLRKEAHVCGFVYLRLADGPVKIHLHIVQFELCGAVYDCMFVVHRLKYCSNELMDVRFGCMVLAGGCTTALDGVVMQVAPRLIRMLSDASMSILAL